MVLAAAKVCGHGPATVMAFGRLWKELEAPFHEQIVEE
jgi:hypothetical protein